MNNIIEQAAAWLTATNTLGLPNWTAIAMQVPTLLLLGYFARRAWRWWRKPYQQRIADDLARHWPVRNHPEIPDSSRPVPYGSKPDESKRPVTRAELDKRMDGVYASFTGVSNHNAQIEARLAALEGKATEPGVLIDGHRWRAFRRVADGCIRLHKSGNSAAWWNAARDWLAVKGIVDLDWYARVVDEPYTELPANETEALVREWLAWGKA